MNALATGLVAATDESDKAGPLALLVVALLGIAVYFLSRSMAKHLRRVPASFDPPAGTPAEPDPAADQPDADTAVDPAVRTTVDRPDEPGR